MIQGRSDIYTASRIVIKAGTSVVSTPDGYPSLSRIANIVENAARLAKEGKQVMIVTSGACLTSRLLRVLRRLTRMMCALNRCGGCWKAEAFQTRNHAQDRLRPAVQEGVS
jgi:hypothetical protein